MYFYFTADLMFSETLWQSASILILIKDIATNILIWHGLTNADN